MNCIRRHYNFSGRVQGVGFRYIMTDIANQLHLVGWVKNNYDGTVEAEVEGDPIQISVLIQQLKQDLYIDIKSIKMTDMNVKNNEQKFTIKF